MIVSYNLEAVGDVLICVVANGEGKEVTAERKGQVTKISDSESKEVLGWNFFQASNLVKDLDGKGQIFLSEQQQEELQQAVKLAGFKEELTFDHAPKFVVGHVKTCKKHPDSDHLHLTEIEVDNGEIIPIVCGAPNIKAGLKVVVAKVGAMMPDGLIIWPGELRGEKSFGMVCSARELNLPNAPAKRGILELAFDSLVGESFKF
ncbi:YtpR family tRNA-binding protein [Vagococcus sp.]|uniref:YtpR family tRNA-binding protein n=1 Tax=Vagococcus sp. TaxID=1933889 RepID=UPI003F9DCB27